MILPSVLLSLGMLLLAGAIVWGRRPPAHELEQPPRQPADDLLVRLTVLENAVRGLPSLWEVELKRAQEIVELTKRAAARVERANQRAEEKREAELFPDGVGAAPVLERLYPQIHRGDGSGGGAPRVYAVPTSVAGNGPPDLSAITGVKGR